MIRSTRSCAAGEGDGGGGCWGMACSGRLCGMSGQTLVLLLFVAVIASADESVHAADDQGMKRLLAPDAKVEKLAGGMKFTEGPVWMSDGDIASGASVGGTSGGGTG